MTGLSTHDKQKLRKRLFVNRTIQGRALLHLAFYWGIYHVVLWHAMFMVRYFEYYRGVLNGNRLVSFGELYSEFVAQNTSMVMCAAAVFPIILYDMLKFTHRVAGPLVRFQNALKMLGDGKKISRIKTRDGDLLTEFEETFNTFLERSGNLADASESSPGSAAADSAVEGRLLAELEQLDAEVASIAGAADSRHAESKPVRLVQPG